MAELKTKQTKQSVDAFIGTITDASTKRDCNTIIEMMKQATSDEPKMWGSSIVGFGSVHLKYASGRELDWMKMGFSPRKQNLTLYVLYGSKEQIALLKKLGKHSTGKGCLYIKSLNDINKDVLKELIEDAARNKRGC